MPITRNQSVTVGFGNDNGVIIRVQYIGAGTASFDTAGGTRTIVFTDTDVTATTATLPTSNAATAGDVVLSDASANTAGELLDIINDSTNFRAHIVDALRGSLVDTGSVALVVDNTAGATLNQGDTQDINWDSSVVADGLAKEAFVSIGPEVDTDVRFGGQLSTTNITRRKEPAATISAGGVEISNSAPLFDNRDERPLSQARVNTITHTVSEDEATPVALTQVEVFDVGQDDASDPAVSVSIFSTGILTEGTDVLPSPTLFAKSLKSSDGRRLVIRQTATPSSATFAIDAFTLTVTGGYGPPGGDEE